MGEQISPVNITGAALISQFSIIVIMFIGTAIADKVTHLFFIILLLAISSIGCLVFTDEFSKIWSPMLNNLSIPNLYWSKALMIVFLLNILCAFVLVMATGGSKSSPFTPLYFLFPPLAIFLREPLLNIVVYVLLISTLFTIKLRVIYTQNTYAEVNRNTGAFWFVSVACFLLTTFIGYVTRPK